MLSASLRRRKKIDVQRWQELPAMPGVYLLVHRMTADTYVRSGADVRVRIRGHLSSWRNGTCTADRLDRLVRSHGPAFDVLTLAITFPSMRLWVEQVWIDRLRPTLNKQRRLNLRPRSKRS